jgi:ABC-type transport system involved in multi-copper enzyme maturation permease subunit
MLGPVFLLEWKSAARRSRHFRFRNIYMVVLLAEFCFFVFAWATRGFDPFAGRMTPWRVTALVIADYLPLFTIQHLLLLLLVTPALAAGSISDEKARGTLPLLLTTQLTAAEIVLGKWLGQAAQVLVLAMPAVPIVTFLHAMCGLMPEIVLAWAIESVVLALLLSALSLLTSVWARTTTAAVVSVYAILAAALAAVWLAGLGGLVSSLTLISPPFNGLHRDWQWLMLAPTVLSLACVAVTAWRLRPVCAVEGAHRPRRRWSRWLDRPPVSNAPVRWKERYVGELGLLTFARKLPRWAAIGLTFALGLAAAWWVPGDGTIFAVHGIGMILLVGLAVAVRSSGTVCRERERQTWDGLLVTPLTAYDLVRGKLWGIIDSIKPYMLAYLLGTLVWSFANGIVAPFITGLCWLACWPMLYFQAANGVYQSARATGSWRALLLSLVTGVAATFRRGTIALAIPALFGQGLVAVFQGILLAGPGQGAGRGIELIAYGVAAVAILGFVVFICMHLFSSAEYLLQQAEKHLAEQDRIKQRRNPRAESINLAVQRMVSTSE